MTRLLACLLLLVAGPSAAGDTLYPDLASYLARAVSEYADIPAERQKQLRKLALYIRTQMQAERPVQLTFICTHNSRRSQFAQAWADVASRHYGIDGVKVYSGGTEVTAFNPRAVAALERAGFRIASISGDANPHYSVRAGDHVPAFEAYSKVYSDSPNPTSGFAAVMTCSEADRNCPNVKGAALRISLPYEDPKEADGSEREAAVYDERLRQISREILWLFSQVRA